MAPGPMRRRRAVRLRSTVETKPYRIFDGFKYHSGRPLKDGARKLICAKHDSNGCNAQGILSAEDVFTFVKKKDKHNHQKDENAEIIARFEAHLYTATCHQFRKTELIYNDVARSHQEAAQLQTFPMLQKRMQQWKKSMKLPKAITLDLLYSKLQSSNYKNIGRHDYGKAEIKFIKSNNNDILALMIYDLELLRKVPTETMYLESSNLIPNNIGGKQTTIICTQHADHIFPILYVIMFEKNQETCTKLIEEVKRLTSRQLPINIYTDYDVEMNNALSAAFPDAVINGTFITQCKILMKEAIKEKINLNNGDSKIILAKIIALSLLPPDKIERGFYWVLKAMKDSNFKEFLKFLQYYEVTWLHNVKPEKMSCFGNTFKLLSNVDLILRNINNQVAEDKNVWSFIETVIKMFKCSHYHLQHYEAENSINWNTNKIKNIFTGQKNFKHIENYWQAIVNECINLSEFLRIVGTQLKGILIDLTVTDIDVSKSLKLPDDEPPQPALPLTEIPRKARAELLEEAGREQLQRLYQIKENDDILVPHEDYYFLPVCAVCLENPSRVGYKPCYHLQVCELCDMLANQMYEAENKAHICPVCRQKVEHTEVFSLEEEGQYVQLQVIH